MHHAGMAARRLLGTTALALALFVLVPAARDAQDRLPASLPDSDFWTLIQQTSEPDGYFRSNSGSPDNLLSNESSISGMAAVLAARVKPGGVYLGVGPEQNFTYIAAMRARMAFITDIRRGNLHLHLLYKALFEMSSNRLEFVGGLFSRKQPAGLPAGAGAGQLMSAYLAADAVSEAAFKSNLSAVQAHLTKTRKLPLNADDLAGIEYVYRNFFRFGPAIHYTSSIGGTNGAASYARIQSAIDTNGTERTYLASEDLFGFVKSLQQRNLVVPIVGNFAGSHALKSIGVYLRSRGAVVGAFYPSNVEQYLQQAGTWTAFCANVASLPLDPESVFIRAGGRAGSLTSMATDTAACR